MKNTYNLNLTEIQSGFVSELLLNRIVEIITKELPEEIRKAKNRLEQASDKEIDDIKDEISRMEDCCQFQDRDVLVNDVMDYTMIDNEELYALYAVYSELTDTVVTA